MQMKKFSLTFALGAVVLLASNVTAHGRLLEPPTRIAPGDENQGFTLTRGPTNQEPCAGVPFQGVKSQFSPGQTFPIRWEIGAAHRGRCLLQLSTNGESDFQTIKEVPDCANSNGIFDSQATLPAGVTCEQCVLRWRWEAELTKELYLNCADISIGGSGGAGSGEQPPAGEQPPPPGDQPPTTETPNEPPTTGEQPPSPAQPGEQPPSPAQPGEQPSSPAQPGEQPPSPAQPGEQPPTTETPPPTEGQPQPADGAQEPTGEHGGTTDANSGAKVSRRSTPRGRPRRLRRSA